MVIELYVGMKIANMCRQNQTTLPFLRPETPAPMTSAPTPLSRAWAMVTTFDHYLSSLSRGWGTRRSVKVCQVFLRPMSIRL